MNRKNLTAAVLAGLAGAAGIAGTAQAVNLNPDGLGQVLIYPYYTVNGGNLTLLSVVNTTDAAKAVKVRFLEGQNSQEVLDFNLYMSAYDVWAAAIIDDAGTPTLVIPDNSCTVPYLYGDFGGMQAFLNAGLDDGGSTELTRAMEGHFEMIEMGVLTNDEMDSAIAATHVDGVPKDCGQLVDAWTQGPDGTFGTDDDGYWIDVEDSPNSPDYGPLTDIDDPSGGLFGGASVINVANGTLFSYDARAVNGYASSRAPFGDALHSFPGTTSPGLNDGGNFTGTVFTDDGGTESATYFGDMAGVNAVSYVFMHDAIMNEYNVDTDFGAASEWVVTFPTKRFYVNSVEPIAPFESVWSDNSDDGIALKDGACEPMLLDKVWDREEQDIFNQDEGDDCPPIVSPGEVICGEPFVPFRLCLETNVVRFGDLDTAGGTSDIFGASGFVNVDTGDFSDGWARFDLMRFQSGNVGAEEIFFRDPLGDDSDWSGTTQWGLPVTGFWAMEIENNFLGDGADVLANYGGLFNHKATRCFAGPGCRED
jgi:hypothetical protein